MPDISKLLNAESVAIVGASPDPTRLRGLLFHVICREPYEGRIYPVTPTHEEIDGRQCYATVDDLPETVDLAVLLVPADKVAAELDRCGRAGIKAAAIVASGFAEQTGAAGEALQRDLADTIKRHDMAVTGPNALGFVNFAKSFCPTFSPAIARSSLPLLPEWHDAGGRVAVIAQSGAIGFGIYDRGRLREIPFRYVVTTGNEAGLKAFDVVEYMLDEGETDIFCMFLEDIRDGDQFRRVAARALRAGKPIVAVKIGRSEAAQESAASHTGAMAGADRVNRAVLEEYGITLCEDLDQLVDVTAAFYHNANKLPQGRRVAIAAGSGGGGGWMCDACDAVGLEIPVLDADARKAIDAVLPPYGSSRNPVDGTAQAVTTVGYAELTRMTAAANNVDSAIMVTSARAAHVFQKEREKFAEIGRNGVKPIAVWTYTWPTQETIAFFAASGLPLLTDTANVARAMAALVTYRETRDAFVADDVYESTTGEGLIAGDRETVLAADHEAVARRLLAEHGIGAFTGQVAMTRDEALQAFAAIDGPAAMKIQSADIVHKSDIGGVRLNLSGDGAALGDAFDQMMTQVVSAKPDARIAGALIEPMAPGGVEMILGVQNDRTFGPMMLVGLGGIYAEVFDDTVLSSPVGSRDAAVKVIRRLKGAALLQGARGKPAADIDALADTIVALSRFARRFGPALASIDLNPVIVHPAGQGVTVADAFIEPAAD